MMQPQFIHLRLHSEYSIVDGLVRIDDVVKAAAKDMQPALALTDLSNLFGLVKFYKSARKEGVKPIVGCDVWVSNNQEKDKPSRLLLLVKNQNGYLRLCELLSRAWLENQNRGRAEIKTEWLEALAENEEENGLIALSGFRDGDIGMALDKGNPDIAEKNALRWARIFPDSFYIEIQRAGQPGAEQLLRQSVELAARLQLPVVATHPVQFLSAEEFTAHEARICISGGEILSNKRRTRRFNEQQSFLSQAEMVRLFEDLPGALQNSVEIAKRCNLTLELGKPRLPDFPTPDGMSLDEFLVHEAKEGLKQRLLQLYPDEAEREAARPRYEERLDFETGTINNMGFAGYFLIVADFIRWAKQNGVPVGPGRGSGAGSLVAYSLSITDLDPLAYNLLFERFLNPERVSMPDFDIDFCQEGRDRVIQYVKERYGKDAVSQIATFGTMAAKAAVRDVGRVLDLGYNFCDGISKLIPFKPGKLVTISEAKKEEPLLAERESREEEVRQLLALAEQVEGITRNVGMHAGGVLIAPGKLTDFCPLYTQGNDSGVVSHFDKKDVEEIGLVKFDFLGLATLTILDLAARYIRELDPAMADFTLESIPLNDRATYELLTKAQTVAVFQLESRGMQGMLKEARPDRFEDIIALVALYRPGPMDLIPDFCRRKHGERFEYPDPRTEGILSETYGIMVYQEQVMQMAQIIGGYSLGGADLLRRAMGKKDADEMAAHRQIFREGAAKNDLSETKADEIFDLMEKFAGYGFNKSHAAAYALLAYQTAYLKTHYPAAFMAANLSLAMDDTDKIRILVEDARDVCGLTLLPPDINLSVYRFRPVGEPPSESGNPIKEIRYGLGAVRGSGEAAIEAIVSARETGGPFTDLFDFCMRVDRRQINRRTIDSLIRAGAMDGFGENRAVMLASVPLAMEAAEQAEASANQGSLFGSEEAVLQAVEYVKVPHWAEKQKLQEEKDALGFCMSGHLFHAYEEEAKKFGHTRIASLAVSREPRWVAGIISSMRNQMSQRGRMAVVTLDDGSATVEVTIFSELLEQKKQSLKEDEFLLVFGKISEDRFSGGLRINADEVLDIAGARVHFYKHLRFSLTEKMHVDRLRELLIPHVSKDGLALLADFQAETGSCEISFGDDWRVKPTDECLLVLNEMSHSEG
ncbi:DNA polymerase III subunit alpha [Oxalobacter sp. OttesenSCG-928-P03]|nr:DNA polymerase III subunit alpha [Oxalobacter sp. OttesenSCG-928-P03]